MPEKRKLDTSDDGTSETADVHSKPVSEKEGTASYGFDVQVGAFGNKGLKQHLEDTWTAVLDLGSAGEFPSLSTVRSAFFALYDGHAGRFASEFCAEKLHLNIASKIEHPTINENVRKAIFEGFKETDNAFLALASTKNYKDGCTAVTATLVQDILFVAWVGDSKAVLARRETDDAQSRLKALNITKDHSCIQAKERDRIVKAGGFIENNRVSSCQPEIVHMFNPTNDIVQVNGIMEVSRSIGDPVLKKSGVICVPEIQRITLCPRDEFMLLACDGLWYNNVISLHQSVWLNAVLASIAGEFMTPRMHANLP
jgi:serine/threonine protein phosphatase PrpC